MVTSNLGHASFCICAPMQLALVTKQADEKNLYFYRNLMKLYYYDVTGLFENAALEMTKHVITSKDIHLKRPLILLLQLFQYQFFSASFIIVF